MKLKKLKPIQRKFIQFLFNQHNKKSHGLLSQDAYQLFHSILVLNGYPRKDIPKLKAYTKQIFSNPTLKWEWELSKCQSV